MANIEMLNTDCMAYMAGLPDKAFELAIVDPPYGIKKLSANVNRSPDSKYRRSMAKMVESAREWNRTKPTDEYWNQLFRVSREQIIWGANNFRLPETEYFVVWDKMQTVNNFASAEYAWVSMNKWKKPAQVFRYQIHGARSADGEKIHPTQKPVALYKWLLSRYAKQGDKILDTHGGSGSICIACHDLGFDLTWMELDKDYYEAALERFKRHTAQNELFTFEGGSVV